MQLPHVSQAAVDRRKVTDDLLAGDHPEGAGTAAFFTRFGFSAVDPDVLVAALVEHARTQPVTEVFRTEFGVKCRVDGPIECPDGRAPDIRAIWIIDASGVAPRLVTAYPLE